MLQEQYLSGTLSLSISPLAQSTLDILDPWLFLNTRTFFRCTSVAPAAVSICMLFHRCPHSSLLQFLSQCHLSEASPLPHVKFQQSAPIPITLHFLFPSPAYNFFIALFPLCFTEYFTFLFIDSL